MIYEMPDLKIRNPYLSLALEDAAAEYLGESYESQGITGIFRFWANSHSIVLGRTCDTRKNIRSEFLDGFEPSLNPLVWKHQPMITRRVSGGGTVLHGPGNVNFTVLLPMEHHPDLFAVRHSYDVFLSMVAGALEAQGVHCGVRGLSDLVLDPDGQQRKISGNAQFRKYGVIAHHGTLIVQKDIISVISRFLNHPPAEPEYRKHRSHDDFLMNLPDHFELSAFYTSLLSRLRSYLDAESTICPARAREEITRRARRKVHELYCQRDWILDGVLPSATVGLSAGKRQALRIEGELRAR